VVSSEVGKGSTFSFSIPVTVLHPANRRGRKKRPSASRRKNIQPLTSAIGKGRVRPAESDTKKTAGTHVVLIIEDNVSTISLPDASNLEKDGYQVISS